MDLEKLGISFGSSLLPSEQLKSRQIPFEQKKKKFFETLTETKISNFVRSISSQRNSIVDKFLLSKQNYFFRDPERNKNVKYLGKIMPTKKFTFSALKLLGSNYSIQLLGALNSAILVSDNHFGKSKISTIFILLSCLIIFTNIILKFKTQRRFFRKPRWNYSYEYQRDNYNKTQ